MAESSVPFSLHPRSGLLGNEQDCEDTASPDAKLYRDAVVVERQVRAELDARLLYLPPLLPGVVRRCPELR